MIWGSSCRRPTSFVTTWKILKSFLHLGDHLQGFQFCNSSCQECQLSTILIERCEPECVEYFLQYNKLLFRRPLCKGDHRKHSNAGCSGLRRFGANMRQSLMNSNQHRIAVRQSKLSMPWWLTVSGTSRRPRSNLPLVLCLQQRMQIETQGQTPRASGQYLTNLSSGVEQRPSACF